MIEDELQGMWDIADTGRIQFSAWPRHERQPRTVPAHRARSNKRFLFEAEHAGKMLRRANFAVSGFPVAKDADGFDYWMSAIASDVPRESDVTGIGQDSTGDMSIRVKSGSIDNLVHASKFLCAKMAREESV